MNKITLKSIPNFRDMGGVPVSGNRRIVNGRLLRTEAMAKPEADDAAALSTLQSLSVFDLRSQTERSETPSPYMVNERAELLTVDVPHSSGAANLARTLDEMIAVEPSVLESYMHVTYRQFPQQFAETLRDLLQRLQASETPVLIHCAAGKDRTGFVCAVLQHALGVSAEVIEADYMLSDRYFGADRLAELLHMRSGLTAPAPLLDVMRVRKDYLDSALTAVNQGFGSMDGYLESLGLNGAGRETLRTRLTVSA